MPETLPLGRWLRQLRAAHDLTQEALAAQVGCAVQTIRTFERGLRRPSREMAERLADVLQIPPEQRATFLQTARMPVSPDASLATARTLAVEATTAAPRQRRAQLPVPSNLLIGREAERRTILAQFAAPAGRLVTLVGPGGIGKTRLALQVASDLAAGYEGLSFADGAAFVALAPVADAANVATAIAEALDCSLPGTVAPEAHLLAFLRERSLLVVLDNLEHLLGPDQGKRVTDLISAIGREAPGVRLLVTSRERLRLRDERVVELAGLALPDRQLAAIARSDAVLLFVERARQTLGDFALTPDNRDVVARICRLLDGAPLAIELAAAWVRALSCEEIADEVTRGLDFLALSDRDADPRHRSMRTVIDQSWKLLSEDERGVLARLSVFRGGCRREAAAAVAGATLPLLVALIDKSLLRHTPTGRYEMHELLRQYAEAQLATDPQAAAAAYRRHCTYFATFLKGYSAMLKGPQQHVAVVQLLADIDNIRAACQHAITHRLVELIEQMEDNNVLLWFYELRSWYQEGEEVCRRTAAALRVPAPATPLEQALLANHIGCQGWFTWRCGRPIEGRALLEESLTRLSTLDYPFYRFTSLLQLAFIAFISGDIDFGLAQQAEIETLARRIGDPWSLAQMYYQRSIVYIERQPELAYARFHEGLPHIRSLGDRYILGLTLFHLGTVALGLGKIDEAAHSFAEGLEFSREVGNGVVEVAASNGLAMLACVRGDWVAAIDQCHSALARAQEVGDPWSQMSALVTLGEAEAGSGNSVAARRTLRGAITNSLAVRLLPSAIDAWIRLAQLDIQSDKQDGGLVAILALVRSHPAVSHATVARAGQLWHELGFLVGAQMLAVAEERARQLDPNELGQLLAAYVEGHAMQRLASLLRMEPTELSSGDKRDSAHVQLAESLTERELDVLRLLAMGRSNQQIAAELVVALGTVKRHVNSILGKLQVESRLAAVVRARELHILG